MAINNASIPVPKEAYAYLYEPHLEHLKAYETTDGKQLHLYISGSDGAGVYRAKLVFTFKKYLATIAFQSDTGFACEF